MPENVLLKQSVIVAEITCRETHSSQFYVIKCNKINLHKVQEEAVGVREASSQLFTVSE